VYGGGELHFRIGLAAAFFASGFLTHEILLYVFAVLTVGSIGLQAHIKNAAKEWQ